MVYILFANLWEQDQFLLSLEESYRVTFFYKVTETIYLIRFGRHPEMNLLSKMKENDLQEISENKLERKENISQYFAFLICLNSKNEDEQMSLRLHRLLDKIILDKAPALILVGTSGSEIYGQTKRIKSAIHMGGMITSLKRKEERGETVFHSKIKLDSSVDKKTDYPHTHNLLDSNTAISYCTPYFMHFQMKNPKFRSCWFVDMESFDFGFFCNSYEIRDYACLRICSNIPECTRSNLINATQSLANEFQIMEDKETWKEANSSAKETKQIMVLQKFLHKFVPFKSLINELIPIVDEFTKKRIQFGTGKNFLQIQNQDNFVLRSINEKWSNIYTFPLENLDIPWNKDEFKFKIQTIRLKQKEIYKELNMKFNKIYEDRHP